MNIRINKYHTLLKLNNNLIVLLIIGLVSVSQALAQLSVSFNLGDHIVASTNSSYCYKTINATTSGANGDVTYTWNVAGVTINSGGGADDDYVTLDFSKSSDGQSFNISCSAKDDSGCTDDDSVDVVLYNVSVTGASIKDGNFTVSITPNPSQWQDTGEMDINFTDSGNNETKAYADSGFDGNEPDVDLDDILNSPEDLSNKSTYTGCDASFTVNGVEADSEVTGFDGNVADVVFLSKWTISNFFTPLLQASWDSTTWLNKGFYNGNGPYNENTLYNESVNTDFLNAIDPGNEALGRDGTTVLRDRPQKGTGVTPVDGFNCVTRELDNANMYIADPDSDQGDAACGGKLDDTSVAVNAGNKTINCGDSVYIPSLNSGSALRKVKDHGDLHNNLTQIDVWIGSGGSDMRRTTKSWGTPSLNCLKCDFDN